MFLLSRALDWMERTCVRTLWVLCAVLNVDAPWTAKPPLPELQSTERLDSFEDEMAYLHNASDSELSFLENLTNSGPGREFKDFIVSKDQALQESNGGECPLRQTMRFRRVFCNLLARKERPFMLPFVLPKAIAMVNLGGRRVVFYSQNPVFLQLLTKQGPSASVRIHQSVQQVIEYANDKHLSLFLSYSMPWQAGAGRAYWQLRTLEKKADGTIVDGERCFGVNFDTPRNVTSTMSTDETLAEVLQAEMDAAERHFSSFNLDRAEEEGSDAGSTESRKTVTLQRLVKTLRDELNTAQHKIQSLEDAAANIIDQSQAAATRRIAKVVDEALLKDSTAQKRLEELTKEATANRVENSNLKRTVAEMEASHNGHLIVQKELEGELAIAKSLNEASHKAASTQHHSSSREIDTLKASLNSVNKAHTKTLEQMERHQQKQQLVERSLEAQAEAQIEQIQSLEDVVEALRNEKEVANFEHLRFRKLFFSQKMATKVALMALRQARKKPRRGRKPQTKSTNTEPLPAPLTTHIFRRALSEADEELALANAALLEVPAKVPEVTEGTEETTPTTVDTPLEQPHERSTEEHHEPQMASPVPMHYENHHDGPIEMLIGQTHTLLRQLSDVARASAHHRYAAESMYSELCSYRAQSPHGFDAHHYYNYGMQNAYHQPSYYPPRKRK